MFLSKTSKEMDNVTVQSQMHKIQTSYWYSLPHACPEDRTGRQMSKRVISTLGKTFRKDDIRHEVNLYNSFEESKTIVAQLTYDEGIITMTLKDDMKANEVLGAYNKLSDFIGMYLPAAKIVDLPTNAEEMTHCMYVEEVFDCN